VTAPSSRQGSPETLHVAVVRGGRPDANTLAAIELAVRSTSAARRAAADRPGSAWARAARLEAALDVRLNAPDTLG